MIGLNLGVNLQKHSQTRDTRSIENSGRRSDKSGDRRPCRSQGTSGSFVLKPEKLSALHGVSGPALGRRSCLVSDQTRLTHPEDAAEAR